MAWCCCKLMRRVIVEKCYQKQFEKLHTKQECFQIESRTDRKKKKTNFNLPFLRLILKGI